MRFDPVKAGVFSYWFIRWTNGCSRRWQFDTRPASSFFSSSSSSSSSSFNCHIHPPRLVTITSQKPIQHHLSNLPSSTSWLRRCRSRSQSLPISNQLARSKCIDLLIIFWTGNWNQIPRGGRERGGGPTLHIRWIIVALIEIWNAGNCCLNFHFHKCSLCTE